MSRPHDRRGLLLLVAVVFVVDAVYALTRHAQYLTGGFDLGLFDQAVRAYSRFEAPVAPIKGVDYNILGDHFHPVLAVLAPLYWIWDDPRVLLVAQAALFAVSVVPVVRFSRRRLVPAGPDGVDGPDGADGRPAGPRRHLPLVVGAAYGFSWPLQAAVDFDFHEIAFAVPLIALLVDALDRRALRTVVATSLALLLVREDMGAVVALAGVVLLLPDRRAVGTPVRAARRVGAALLVGGLVAFWFVTSVAIPALSPSGDFAYWTYTSLGPDAPSTLVRVLTRPWDAVRLFVTPEVKVTTLVLLLAPVLFAALGSRYVLLALPLLAERFLNDRSALWTPEFHYSSVTAPIITLAAVDAVARLAAVLRRREERRAAGRPVRTRGGTLLVAVWTAWTAGFVVVGTLTDPAVFPLHRLLSGQAFTRLERVDDIEAVLRRLPEQVCVEADERITAHLTRDRFVTLPTKSEGLATWVVLDMGQEETGYLAPSPQEALARSTAQGFVEVARQGPILLLQRPGPVEARCRV